MTFGPLHVCAYDLFDLVMSKRPKLAFDIGANDGGMSHILSTHCDFVHAFEPVPYVFEKLRALCETHPNVIPFQFGVSDIKDTVKNLTIYNAWSLLPETCTGISRALDGLGKPSFDMMTTTVDDHSDVYGVPDFIKMDVDGYEHKVLVGARKTLSRHPCPIMFEYSYLGELFDLPPRPMVDFIYDIGYRAWSMDGKYVAETPDDMIRNYPQGSSYDIMLMPR
jgi:FkbM family methyltransferase